MNKRQSIILISFFFVVMLMMRGGPAIADSQPDTSRKSTNRVIKQSEREAAADRKAAQRLLKSLSSTSEMTAAGVSSQATIGPGDVPDYFGMTPNYALSRLPVVNPDGLVVSGTGIRKFIDSLPGLTAANANNLGQYIPVAIPDTDAYPGSDYYEISLVEYTEQLHSDLPAPTKLRGYVQTNTTDPLVSVPRYLGPMIVAREGVPVRVKFTNDLPTNMDGDLFLPVDTTVMGAGMGPNMAMASSAVMVSGMTAEITTMMPHGFVNGEHIHMSGFTPAAYNGMFMIMDVPTPTKLRVMLASDPMGPATVAGTIMSNYTQNRATIHLHGGATPWISDGTPHQWITPAGENTSYPQGVSVYNVPDMPDPGVGDTTDGVMTFYYSNQQSARLMFYHDHAYGITRLNVYAGEAAPYIVRDAAEDTLIADGIIPADEIPLVIQDKTFVPDNTTPFTNSLGTFSSQLAAQDPTWDTAKWGGPGSLWLPHVYMTNENPADVSGMNAMGRWFYGPWFHPPTTDITYGPVPNPYAAEGPWEYSVIPGTPTPSMGMESFMDTPLVNGTPYPYLEVDPKAYRFRILNAADDRFLNLQLYVADSDVITPDGRINTEVKMVPATAASSLPDGWPADGRDGGVPDPATAGPNIVQIGTEGGFLPAPVVLRNMPVRWNFDQTNFDFGNINGGTLILGTAERADVVIDFSQYAGKTLILYNDSPAPFPAIDPRYDYYTGNPDLTDTGGAPSTIAGFGPNTRTIMQIRVSGTAADYVPSLYQSILGRAGDSGGLALWNAALSAGASRTAVAYGFLSSSERYSRFISEQYQYVLGRSAGSGEIAGWVSAMNAGLSERNLMASFYGSAEYSALRVTDSSNQQFLSTIYQRILGRAGDTGGLASWDAALVAGASRTTVAYQFLSSAERYSRFISDQYQSILGRPADSGGLAGWVSAMNAGLSERDLMASFYGSAEYLSLSGGAATPVAPYDVTALNDAFKSTGTTQGVFAASQDPIIVPNAVYNSAYNANFPTDSYARIQSNSLTFTPMGAQSVGSVIIQSGGSGYTTAPDVGFVGAGTGATGTALISGGAVTGVVVVSGGTGYTSPPAVTFSGGGGVGAAATSSYSMTVPFEAKAIQDEMGEAFDKDYGRMSGFLGLEMPNTNASNMMFILFPFASPPVDIQVDSLSPGIPVAGDGTTLWKITHNGVDTHTIHVHLFNAQVINRVAWDGAIRPPDPNELGWKETIRVSPLQDTIIAMRPYTPTLPFEVPNSVRLIDPTMPSDATLTGGPLGFFDPLGDPTTGPGGGGTLPNEMVNFGWEYVWHCHILSHEEMDMMHSLSIAVAPWAPTNLTASGASGNVLLNWTDESITESSFIIQKATSAAGPWTDIGSASANTPTYTDTEVFAGTRYYRVFAANTIGSTALNFPQKTAYSTPTNTVSIPIP